MNSCGGSCVIFSELVTGKAVSTSLRANIFIMRL